MKKLISTPKKIQFNTGSTPKIVFIATFDDQDTCFVTEKGDLYTEQNNTYDLQADTSLIPTLHAKSAITPLITAFAINPATHQVATGQSDTVINLWQPEKSAQNLPLSTPYTTFLQFYSSILWVSQLRHGILSFDLDKPTACYRYHIGDFEISSDHHYAHFLDADSHALIYGTSNHVGILDIRTNAPTLEFGFSNKCTHAVHKRGHYVLFAGQKTDEASPTGFVSVFDIRVHRVPKTLVTLSAPVTSFQIAGETIISHNPQEICRMKWPLSNPLELSKPEIIAQYSTAISATTHRFLVADRAPDMSAQIREFNPFS